MSAGAATIALTFTLTVLGIWDISARRLPDWLTLPLIFTGLLLETTSDKPALIVHLLAAAGGYLFFWVMSRGYQLARRRPGLGLGDAKLLAAAGAWLGPFALAPLVLFAATSALIAAGMMALMGRSITFHTSIAFGPFLCAGFFLLWVAKLEGWAFW